MSKKIYYFALLPMYGGAIVFGILFFKALRNEINRKRFMRFLISCFLVGFLLYLSVNLSIVNFEAVEAYLKRNGKIPVIVVVGYLFNAYFFIRLNKIEEELFRYGK